MANSTQLSLPSKGSSAATATLAHQAGEHGHSQGQELHHKDCGEAGDRILLLLCSLFSVFSFYHFHSSPNLFLLFSSSSFLGCEPAHGSYQSQWVQPLAFEAPNTDPSCALSQARIISSPTKIGLQSLHFISPHSFFLTSPRSHPAVWVRLGLETASRYPWY